MLVLPVCLMLCVAYSSGAGTHFVRMLMRNTPNDYNGDKTINQLWNSFKNDYGKSYKTPAEEVFRRQIFSEAVARMKRHNQLHNDGKTSFTLGINQFSDLTHEEFSMQYKGFRKSRNTTSSHSSTFLLPNVPFTVPDSVDWRTKGYVTPIKNQEQCGSCWAFSTTGSVEGQHFRKTGSLVSLSEQNLIDCCTKEGDQGCSGGDMDLSFQCIIDEGGIDTEDSYPYTAEKDTCSFKPNTVGATVTGFVDVTSGDETALKQAVALNGPVSVAIDANDNFQHYSGGVYDDPTCKSDPSHLDHAVLVVGYGSMDGSDIWIVKNSWGTGWGDDGYVYMSRNKNNQCGIATDASYPTV